MPASNFDDMVRAKIRAEMATQDLTQTEVARRLGWPLTTFNRRLRGHTPLAADHLRQIASALDVNVSDLGFALVTRDGGKGVRS